MIRRALRGLRGRLLLAFVFTSAVTLAVAAAITLSPLQERLREESATALQDAAEDMRPEFNTALAKAGANEAKEPEDYAERGPRSCATSARATWSAPRFDLRERTGGARVLVADMAFTNRLGEAPAFLYDTDFQGDQTGALALAYRALREGRPRCSSSTTSCASRCRSTTTARSPACVVAERSLTEVTTAVKLVRNALFTAAAVGLAVAIGLGLALSSTLTRRLGRLQRSALRITAEGPEAPAPTDRGLDEVGDLARALGRMQEELRRQEAARRAFVSTASHELRTPLTMLQGTMELLDEDLRDGADLADAQEQVESARRELRRLSVLASELLDLSRLDADVQLRSEPVELGEIARAVAAEFGLRAAERDVDLDVIVPTERPVLGARRPGGLRARRADPDRQRAALRAAAASRSRSSRRTTAARSWCASPTTAPASRSRSASTSSSASTAARRRAPRAASGSGWRSAASWRSGWAARSQLVDSAHGACFALTLPG